MSERMTDQEKQRLQEIEERANKATPGPWYWNGVKSHKNVNLLSAKNGHPTVMDFARWGMSEAAPRFKVDGRMERIDDMIVPRQNHRPDGGFYEIDHPDARFIAHAREDIPFLLQQLRASLEREQDRDYEKEMFARRALQLYSEEYFSIDEVINHLKQMDGES